MHKYTIGLIPQTNKQEMKLGKMCDDIMQYFSNGNSLLRGVEIINFV